MAQIQGFGGLTQGFMPLAQQVTQNVDAAQQMAMLNAALNQYISTVQTAARTSGTMTTPAFMDFVQSGGNMAQMPDGTWYRIGDAGFPGGPAYDTRQPFSYGNLFGTGGRAIKYGLDGGGQTAGTGPGWGGPEGMGFPDFQSYMDAVANDQTGLAQAFAFAAGLMGAPAASPAMAQGLGYGTPAPQTFDITAAFSGGAGSSGGGYDPNTGGLGVEGVDYGGESGVGSGGGGQGGESSQSDPSGSDPTGGTGSFRRGGLIPSDRDKIMEARHIKAHEGEFIVRPEAVKKYGPRLLKAINAGKLTKAQARELLRRAG